MLFPHRVRAAVLAVMVTTSIAAAANAQPAPVPATRTAALETARKALQSGEPSAAIEAVAPLIAKNAADLDAVAVKVRALMQGGDTSGAVDAYQAWGTAAKKDDDELLSALARARLRELSKDGVAQIAVRALQALAQAGDSDALSSLVKFVRATPDSPMRPYAVQAMARMGDQRAISEVKDLALSGPPAQRAALLSTVAEVAPADLERLLRAALGDRDLVLKLSALALAGERRVKPLVSVIKPMLDERPSLVSLNAAVALRQLGDAAGNDKVAAALKSELPDSRLLAASAFAGTTDVSWVPVITPLLENEDVLVRVQAAELLLDRLPRATEVLQAALKDPNPTGREEAAKALVRGAAATRRVLVPLLKDPSPWVRLEAASQLAHLVTPGKGH